MFLIFTACAAIISTIIWYVNAPENKYRLDILCYIYWGSTIMWLVDSIIAYSEGEPFFDLSADAAYLGITVVLSGLFAWLVFLLIKDPKKVFAKSLKKMSK